MQSDMISRDGMLSAVESLTWYSRGADGSMHPGAKDDEEAYYRAVDIFDAIKTQPGIEEDCILRMPCPMGGTFYAIIMKRESRGKRRYTIMTKRARLNTSNLLKVCGGLGKTVFPDYPTAKAVEQRIRNMREEEQDAYYNSRPR